MRLHVIRNAIDPTRLKVDENTVNVLRDQLNLHGKTVVLSVSRLHPQKDIETLLGAAARVDRADLIWLIVGDGPERGILEARANALGVKDRVRFLGTRNDVPALLHVADVLVLSTRWEGCPLVVLEAGICGTPAVVSDVPGAREVVRDGVTGLLFPAGDVTALASYVERLANDPDRRRALGHAGNAFVREKFAVDVMIERYRTLYARVLDNESV